MESYPLTLMDRYVRWERFDRLPFNPQLRVHRRLGAGFLQLAPRSIVITGTISEWEEWTGMGLPESGAYIVPGTPQHVVVHLERDLGTYEEPNVLLRLPVAAGRAC